MADEEKQPKEVKTETKTAVKTSKQPVYNVIQITCACGAKYTTGTTYDGPLRVAICSNCHPFYTGEQKIVDTENLVSKFEKKAQKANTEIKSRKDRRTDKRAARAKVLPASATPQKELTLKDIMKALQKGQ
jgi:large subunit ribosomal protein L31